MATGNQNRHVRARENSSDRERHGYFTPGMEWFPEDTRTGEIAETWRHRGYGGSRNMDHDYHYRRGDIGGMGYGDGSMGYEREGQTGAGNAPAQRQRPRALPKNYQRSDARICDEVCERLANARGLDVSEVTVEVGSGIVTLAGTVADRRSKFRVEDIADEVSGVNEVRNNIRVPR